MHAVVLTCGDFRWPLPAVGVSIRSVPARPGRDDLADVLDSLDGRRLVVCGTDADLAAVVLQAAGERGVRLGTAESCTGGLLGGRLTDIPGSSTGYAGGVVCYANELKISLLGVPPDLIEAHGAVSEPVARAMAEGAVERLGVDVAVSVTGIAGPDGGSEDKPVGTVWIGLAGAGAAETRRIVFGGGRHEVRARAAQAALYLTLGRLRAGADLPV